MAMTWCADQGIPPSTYFGGWGDLAPGTFVEGYDAEVILAVLIDKSERCPRCGEREADWYAWNDEAKRMERKDPPKHAESNRCGGCAELDDYQESHAEELKKPGLRVRLVDGPPPLEAGGDPEVVGGGWGD